MWFWKTKKQKQIEINKLEEEINKLKKEKEDLINQQSSYEYAMLRYGYPHFHTMIIRGFFDKSRKDLHIMLSDLYSKFKNADTTKEAQQYLMTMDEVVQSHLEFLQTLPDQIHKDPSKMIKLLKLIGGNIETPEKIEVLAEAMEENSE